MNKALIAAAGVLCCSGPDAPSSAVCQDFIHRMCLAPICQQVADVLNPGSDCEGTLLARTGCGSPDFAFSGISRVHFLECRLPLLRQGLNVNTHPSCDDVGDVFTNCPDVISFLNGGGQ